MTSHPCPPSIVALLLAALLAACAAGPPPSTRAASTADAGGDCHQLASDIAAAESSQHDAITRQEDAWKVIVPFAVAGRYASATSARRQADRRLEQLRAESARLGCRGALG